MNSESVVYGCIKDMLFSDGGADTEAHRQQNRQVLMSLPSVEDWPLLSREMFALPVEHGELNAVRTDVVHFGTSYNGVEYEWQQWLDTFEAMLKGMYWVSATVHLETELNGHHTFTWEAEDSFHEPSEGELSVRCEWSRESSIF
jgi:hypothetical protein